MRRLVLLLVGILLALHGFAQVYSAEGSIVDSRTKEPLAFVTVGLPGQQKGTTTDIDGKFSIQSDRPFTQLSINYLGYNSLMYTLTQPGRKVKIELEKAVYSLRELVVVAGENPANRIIRKAVENKALNNPENLHSFSYESYNKFIYTIDNLKKPKRRQPDTTFMKIEKFMERQHLFMMESVTSRKYMEPEQNKEMVLATKVSGLKEPSFAMLATEFQSFSFYSETIKINAKNYINPLSNGTLGRYLFLLEDTVFEGKDTVYVISFRPRAHKNFDALKGVLYVNTRGYALQNVIAEPVDNDTPLGQNDVRLSVKIQQKYESIGGRHWFPVQLNADLAIRSAVDSSHSVTILGISRSYIKNIQINPPLNKRDFDNIVLDYADSAAHKDEAFWAKYRVDTLTNKEKLTYRVVDSLGRKYKLDKKIKVLEYLALGQIPFGRISFDLDRFMSYNLYEGFRLGVGVHTNDRFLKWTSIGGYVAYGFGDKATKYGYDWTLNLEKRSELKLGLSFVNDISEAGGLSFYKDTKGLLSNENFRNYLLRNMDRVEQKEAALTFRAFSYLNWKFGLSQYTKSATDNYRFNDNGTLLDRFNFTEAEAALRFAFREKLIKTFNQLTPLESKYPILWLQVKEGFKGTLNGQFDYTKLDAKIEKTLFIKGLGEPTIQLAAGYISGVLPYSNDYAGKASLSFNHLGVRVSNTFQAMAMNEFLSDRYVSLFISHNFGKLLYKGKKFQPQLEWANNMGYGTLSHRELHLGRDFKTMDKGYFETGLSVNNIYRSGFYGYGIGLFYRYGYYANAHELDNIALLITYAVSL